MGYVQNRGRACFCYSLNQVEDFLAVAFVKTMTWLVQNQHFRAFYGRTQNQNRALFSVAQAAKVFVLTAFKSAEFKPEPSRLNFDISFLLVKAD